MPKVEHKNLKDRISNLTTQLVMDHPFWGVFLSTTDIIETTSVPTAATDGVRMWYNANFFNQLDDKQVKAVMIHELFHCLYFHCSKTRRNHREPKKWNIAIDYSINWEIDEMDRSEIVLPHDIKIDGRTFKLYLDKKYKNMYAEQIYDLLPPECGSCGKKKCDCGGGFDEHIDTPDDADVRQGVEDRILQSYEIAKQEGKLPLGVSRLVDELRKSRVPWSRVFQRYLGTTLMKSDDYSYATFNRRYVGQNMYLPGMKTNKLATIAVAFDLSGSIGEKEQGAFIAELRKVSALISEVIVMGFDSQVQSFDVIRDMSNFDRTIKGLKGGGGTDIGSPIRYLQTKKIHPEVCIIFTDGYGDFGKKPKFPVIYVITTDVSPPKDLRAAYVKMVL